MKDNQTRNERLSSERWISCRALGYTNTTQDAGGPHQERRRVPQLLYLKVES